MATRLSAQIHRSTIRLTLIIRRTYFYRRYGLVGELDTANSKEYGCHVITNMTKGIGLCQKGSVAWHGCSKSTPLAMQMLL